MRWWFYALLLAMPFVLGENNTRAGGEFLPVFAAGLMFATIAVASLEAAIFTHRLLRRPPGGAAALKHLRHHAA